MSSQFLDNNKLIAILKPYGSTHSWKTGHDYWIESFFIEILPEFCKKWPHANLLYTRRKGWVVNDEKGFNYLALFFQLRNTYQEAKNLKNKNVFMFTANKGIIKYNWQGGKLFYTPKKSYLRPLTIKRGKR